MSDMKSESENAVDGTGVYYLTLPVESSDQATSLSNYLNAHGVEAVSEGVDGVTCPITEPELAVDIHQLCKSWRRFWKHSDEEVLDRKSVV